MNITDHRNCKRGENAKHENAEYENVGHNNAGHEITGHDNAGLEKRDYLLALHFRVLVRNALIWFVRKGLMFFFC